MLHSSKYVYISIYMEHVICLTYAGQGQPDEPGAVPEGEVGREGFHRVRAEAARGHELSGMREKPDAVDCFLLACLR